MAGRRVAGALRRHGHTLIRQADFAPLSTRRYQRRYLYFIIIALLARARRPADMRAGNRYQRVSPQSWDDNTSFSFMPDAAECSLVSLHISLCRRRLGMETQRRIAPVFTRRAMPIRLVLYSLPDYSGHEAHFTSSPFNLVVAAAE